MKQLCKESFQKKTSFKPLNKSKTSVSWTEQFSLVGQAQSSRMAKTTRSTLSLLQPAAGWRGVRWRLACRRRQSGSCVLSAPSQLQMSSPGVGKMTKSCSCLDGRLTQSCSSALSLHPPPPLNNTILPPKIKLYLYLYNTPPSPPSPPAVPVVYVTDKR